MQLSMNPWLSQKEKKKNLVIADALIIIFGDPAGA